MILPLLLLALAQSVSYGPTDSYVVAVFANGTTPPAAPLAIIGTVKASEVLCDLPTTAATAIPVHVAPTMQVGFEDPDHPGRACITPVLPIAAALPVCPGDPCPLFAVFLQAVNAGGTAWSTAATPLHRTTPTAPSLRSECIGPLGNRAVSIFPTNISGTNGRAGARAVQNFQLASPNSPIIEVALRIDGVVVDPVARGENLTPLPGWWFTMPPTGRHTMTIHATNAHGCSREVAAAPLTVP